MRSTDKDALKAANHVTSFEAQRNIFLLGVHEEPLSNPADILALVMASVFFDLPTPTRFEVLDRLGPRGPKMAGILAKHSQLNVVLTLYAASLAVPESEWRGGPLSLSHMAHAAKPLLQLMALVAKLEQSEGAYPVSTLAELHMQFRVELEAEGTLYPSPEPIARYWLAVQCALEQHVFRLCMLSLWEAPYVERNYDGVARRYQKGRYLRNMLRSCNMTGQHAASAGWRLQPG
eukprot:3831414-Pleurochrysis_carterae.AAC.1